MKKPKTPGEDWTAGFNRIRWFHLMMPAVIFIIIFHLHNRHRILQTPPSPSIPDKTPVVNPVDNAPLVRIPPGLFYMGAVPGDESASVTEKPLHRVCLEEYYIYKYEVTREQFKKFVDATGYVTTAERRGRRVNWRTSLNPGTMNYPVKVVSHQDATAYARWAGGDLPTEAQWERAARGDDKRIYPWGNSLDLSRFKHQIPLDPDGNPIPQRTSDPVIFSLIHSRQPEESVLFLDFAMPVGSYPRGASPYGVMDMLGNAFEFCGDYFGYFQVYEGFYRYDPAGITDGSMVVVKGGGDCDDVDNFRISCRDRAHPDEIADDFGFRLVMTPAQLDMVTAGENPPATRREVEIICNPADRARIILIPSPSGQGKPLMGIYLHRVTNRQLQKYFNNSDNPPHEGYPVYQNDMADAPAMNVHHLDARGYAHWAGGRLPSSGELQSARHLSQTTSDSRVLEANPHRAGDQWVSLTIDDETPAKNGFRVVIPPENLNLVDINQFRGK